MVAAAVAAVVCLVAGVALLPGTGAGAVGAGSTHGFSGASTGALSFTTFTCTFTVPALPATYTEQSVFLWCGVQQAGDVDGTTSFGVIQPVVMYGPDCASGSIGLGPDADPHYGDPGGQYWYYSAQYIHAPPGGGSGCSTSPDGFIAAPGDVLVSTFTYDPVADTITNTIARQDGSNRSTFVATHPNMDPTLSWSSYVGHFRLIMSVESVGITGSSDWPAAPASWPVTMEYTGDDPGAFQPEVTNREGPTLECGRAVADAGSASAVCTYDLASTQLTDLVSTTTTAPAVAAVTLTPSFTG